MHGWLYEDKKPYRLRYITHDLDMMAITLCFFGFYVEFVLKHFKVFYTSKNVQFYYSWIAAAMSEETWSTLPPVRRFYSPCGEYIEGKCQCLYNYIIIVIKHEQNYLFAEVIRCLSKE